MKLLGSLGALWGLGGVAALVVVPLARLAPAGLGVFSLSLGAVHWVVIVLWVSFMIWREGIAGFHRSFSPMVAARARYLRDHPRALHVVLAPLYCVGFIHATRRRKVRTAILTVAIVLLVIVVARFPAPWRGIVDLGVVAGLGIGLLSMTWHGVRALTRPGFDFPTEVPDPAGHQTTSPHLQRTPAISEA